MLHVISVATSATPQQIVGMMPRARKVVAKGKECNVIIAGALATSRAIVQIIAVKSAMQMAAGNGEANLLTVICVGCLCFLLHVGALPLQVLAQLCAGVVPSGRQLQV